MVQGELEAVFDLVLHQAPLKVLAGDIDGDGRVEIGVCVYKTAKFHPVPAKRPFFYALQDGRLQPVWLGSRLAWPFADYRLFDLMGTAWTRSFPLNRCRAAISRWRCTKPEGVWL